MTTATLSLTHFLLARIAEDEALAEAAMIRRTTWATAANTAASVAGADAGLFILFTPPDRVLAECEAKRRIVESEVAPYPVGHAPATRTLRYLAAIYADHEDYRAEWSA